MLGDQIKLSALYSDENLWLGSAGYSAPLGSNGLRGNVAYAHTSYALGKEFGPLQANGTARVANAGLSYPLLRSQAANLSVNATWQHKNLQDNTDSTATRSNKSSNSLPLTLQFDLRDAFGGGGITYGSVGWTAGHLMLDSAGAAADALNTRGSFQKFNLDVVRQQALWSNVSLQGRLSSQWASKNLDSSERMSLGGANGVRAYPTGEANGDTGWLAQIELRYLLGEFTPYAFYDQGSIRVNTNPLTTATSNSRSIAGLGLGLGYQQGPWKLDLALAWRTEGGSPRSDASQSGTARFWLNLGYQF